MDSGYLSAPAAYFSMDADQSAGRYAGQRDCINWLSSLTRSSFCNFFSWTALEKDLKLNQLRKLGLIEFAKKVSNLSIRVLFLNNKEDEGKLFVSDFRKLGYEWKVYNGEKYIRCAGCGILAHLH